MRRLVSLNQKGELNKVTFNGQEVRILIVDLLRGEQSLLLMAIADTFKALGLTEEDTHLSRWREVFGHWARAMHAGYKMRPSADDRRTFRAESKLYSSLKSAIRPGITNWYDWQLFSILPDQFDRWGSLMLMSQEGMEAINKRQNMLMRLNNNFSNASRIPTHVKRAGLDAVRAHMEERKKRKKSPERWLYDRNLMSFVAHFSFSFESAKACAKEGRVLDSDSFYEPAWDSFRGLAAMRFRLWGRWQVVRVAKTAGGEMPASADVVVDRLLRDPDKLATTHYTDYAKSFTLNKTYTLRIKTKTEHGLEMAEMIAAYYDVQPETSGRGAIADDVSDRVRRIETERARKKAWKKNKEARAPVWAAREQHELAPTLYKFTPPPTESAASEEQTEEMETEDGI